jgi:hypothetical protein
MTFFDDLTCSANISLEPNVKLTQAQVEAMGNDFETVRMASRITFVCSKRMSAKFWRKPVSLTRSTGFSPQDLSKTAESGSSQSTNFYGCLE